MPRGSFSHTVAVPAQPQEVWERFQEPDTWQGIGPIDDIADVRVEGERLISFTWNTHVGPTRYRGKSSMIENHPPDRVVMRLDSNEMIGRLTVALTAVDASTQVEVTLDYATKGTMASLFFPVISQAIESGLGTQVDEFAAGWEAD